MAGRVPGEVRTTPVTFLVKWGRFCGVVRTLRRIWCGTPHGQVMGGCADWQNKRVCAHHLPMPPELYLASNLQRLPGVPGREEEGEKTGIGQECPTYQGRRARTGK